MDLNILIVEDDEDVRFTIVNKLKKHQHEYYKFLVTEAEDGLQGLSLLQQGSFDAAVVDMAMPNLNGAEMIAKLREQEGPNRNIPIVILSGYSDMYMSELHQPNYDNILPLEKPANLSKLIRTLLLALGKK